MLMESWSGKRLSNYWLLLFYLPRQCDKAVNKITPGLWARIQKLEDLASANLMMLRCVCERLDLTRIK